MKNVKILIWVAILVLGASWPLGALFAETPSACTFTRDLEVGDAGEDVLCLQKFLNATGYTIAPAGVGSPGAETDLFGELTEKALMSWQMAKGVSPASGYFGPRSRAAYSAEVYAGGGLPSTALPPATVGSTDAVLAQAGLDLPTLQGIIAKVEEYARRVKELEAEKAVLENGRQEEIDVREMLREARELLEDAEDRIDDADDDGEDVTDEQDDWDEGTEEIVDGLHAFIEGDYSRARNHAEEARELAEDVVKSLGGDEEEARDAIDDADSAIDDAKEEIRDAKRDDDDVDEAEDLLDEAQDYLDDAEDAYDDEDYDEVIDLAEEAEDLAKQAVRAL